MSGDSEPFDAYAYHLDLRGKAAGAAPEDDLARLHDLVRDPERANPVSVAQLGLGVLQLGDPACLPVVAEIVAWLERTVDDRGRLPYRRPMPHTFPLESPWYSALAQGEAASLLVRAAIVLGRGDLFELADGVAGPLLDAGSPLVARTAEGPVLQEYPTEPPSHVLNGWLFALWGLHDLASAPRPGPPTPAAREARTAFAEGAEALGARIHLYRTRPGWSLYDLYPHPLPNVASPFYHGLHVVQLRRQDRLAPDPRLRAVADEWDATYSAAGHRAVAVARKVAFRTVRPRWRRIRPAEVARTANV